MLLLSLIVAWFIPKTLCNTLHIPSYKLVNNSYQNPLLKFSKNELNKSPNLFMQGYERYQINPEPVVQTLVSQAGSNDEKLNETCQNSDIIKKMWLLLSSHLNSNKKKVEGVNEETLNDVKNPEKNFMRSDITSENYINEENNYPYSKNTKRVRSLLTSPLTKNIQRITLKYDLPNLNQPACKDAFVKLIQAAHYAYLNVVKNPSCGLHSENVPSFSIGKSPNIAIHNLNNYLNNLFDSVDDENDATNNPYSHNVLQILPDLDQNSNEIQPPLSNLDISPNYQLPNVHKVPFFQIPPNSRIVSQNIYNTVEHELPSSSIHSPNIINYGSESNIPKYTWTPPETYKVPKVNNNDPTKEFDEFLFKLKNINPYLSNDALNFLPNTKNTGSLVSDGILKPNIGNAFMYNPTGKLNSYLDVPNFNKFQYTSSMLEPLQEQYGIVPIYSDQLGEGKQTNNTVVSEPTDKLLNGNIQFQNVNKGILNSQIFDQIPEITNNNMMHTLMQQLNAPQNKDNVVELTYILKRPVPLLYQPLYYVKYRLPYNNFIRNIHSLLKKNALLRNNPQKLYQELVDVSNITEVSPDLKKYNKEDILKLVFKNGALVTTKFLNDSSLPKAEISAIQQMNSYLKPSEISDINKQQLADFKKYDNPIARAGDNKKYQAAIGQNIDLTRRQNLVSTYNLKNVLNKPESNPINLLIKATDKAANIKNVPL